MIRYDTLATITQNMPKYVKKPLIKLVTVTGDPVDLLGSVTLILYLGNSKIIHTFHIAKPQKRMKPLLLGLDFLNKSHISLHFNSGYITYRDERIPLFAVLIILYNLKLILLT